MTISWLKHKGSGWLLAAIAALAVGAALWSSYTYQQANEYCISKWRSPAIWVAGKFYCRLTRRGNVIYRRVGK